MAKDFFLEALVTQTQLEKKYLQNSNIYFPSRNQYPVKLSMKWMDGLM